MRFLLIPICLLFAAVSILRAEEKPDPREKLDTTIAETIRLIEAKDTAALIKFVLPPKELQQRLENKTIEEVAKEIEAFLPNALKILKQIQGTKPGLNEDETRAVYELKEAVDVHKVVTFVKEEKFWYIK